MTFPVIDGAPILLGPASVFARPESEMRHYAKRTTSRLRDLVFRITPDLELKVGRGARALEDEVLALGRRPTRLLNIGGKHRGAATSALRSRGEVEILELDFSLSALTQAVADPQCLPLPDDSFDVVVVDAVLEHMPDPAAATGEIHRVLRSGGLVFADTPFLLPVHAGPFDFSRFSHVAHRKLFAQFDELKSGISNGPAMALSWSIQQFLLSFVSSQGGRYAVKLLCRLGLFWLKYADLLLHNREAAYDGALAFYFLGRKSGRCWTDQEIVSSYRGITPSLLNEALQERASPGLSPQDRRRRAAVAGLVLLAVVAVAAAFVWSRTTLAEVPAGGGLTHRSETVRTRAREPGGTRILAHVATPPALPVAANELRHWAQAEADPCSTSSSLDSRVR